MRGHHRSLVNAGCGPGRGSATRHPQHHGPGPAGGNNLMPSSVDTISAPLMPSEWRAHQALSISHDPMPHRGRGRTWESGGHSGSRSVPWRLPETKHARSQPRTKERMRRRLGAGEQRRQCVSVVALIRPSFLHMAQAGGRTRASNRERVCVCVYSCACRGCTAGYGR